MRSIIIVTIMAAILMVSVAMAESPREKAAEKREIVQDKKELKQTNKAIEKLDRLIGEWHEAYLSGDESKIQKYEQAIINTLIKDINASYKAVKKAEQEARRSKAEIRTHRSARAAADDKQDLARARKLLASKQGLLYRLRTNESFSLKYRLLADYQDLLKWEYGFAGREFAEDISAARSDRK